MEVGVALAGLMQLATSDPGVRRQLEETRKTKEHMEEFCRLSTKLGFPIAEMDLLTEGEAMYAQMKRSVNGGGDSDPMLDYEDDYYEQFFADLEQRK